MTGLVVEPEDGETYVLGKQVSELQEDVTVNDNSITGTLNYVTGFTGFSGNPELQEGNFLALKFEHPDGATTTVEIIGGTSGPVELDSDMNWVGRIASNEQSIEVITTLTDGTTTITKEYNLTGLVLNEETVEENAGN